MSVWLGRREGRFGQCFIGTHGRSKGLPPSSVVGLASDSRMTDSGADDTTDETDRASSQTRESREESVSQRRWPTVACRLSCRYCNIKRMRGDFGG